MPQRLHDQEYSALVGQLVLLRRSTGVSQTELAARLDRPQSFVSKYERLERRLDIGEWREIVLALGHDPVELFAEADAILRRGVAHS